MWRLNIEHKKKVFLSFKFTNLLDALFKMKIKKHSDMFWFSDVTETFIFVMNYENWWHISTLGAVSYN